jgi:outer membrane protein assembly factor BamD (BamD/ComL family)
MKKYFTLCTLLVALVTGCSPSKEKRAERIKETEDRLYSPSATGFSRMSADSLLTMYENFITDYPDDTLVSGYLFKGATLAMNIDDGAKAVSLFDQYLKDFPEGPKAPLCAFFRAYVQENIMKNLDQAKESYLQFLEKYPDHDFSDDARAALENLGKSPEQLIREFEARQKSN